MVDNIPPEELESNFRQADRALMHDNAVYKRSYLPHKTEDDFPGICLYRRSSEP